MQNETTMLKEAIMVLQEKREIELMLLKEEFCSTYESLKPINLIKSTFGKISSSPDLKSNILGGAFGIGTGILSKKLLFGRSSNPIKVFFGTVIQFAIANVVSKNADDIKSTGQNLLYRFLNHRKESKKEKGNRNNELATYF